MPRVNVVLMLLLWPTACGPLHRPPAESIPPAPLVGPVSPAPAVNVGSSAPSDAAMSPAGVPPLAPLLDAAAPAPAADTMVSVLSIDALLPAPAVEAMPTVAVAPAIATPRLGCGDHPSVDAWERRLGRERRASTTALLARGERMLPQLKRIVAETGAPSGLALVSAIESGFRTDARGRRGERGLWQLKPQRARQLGLVVTTARDDRLDPELATRAAARHLLALHDAYDDWALALAAYVAGEGRVDRALRAGHGMTFWDLAGEARLPRTARDFVVNVFALVRVAAPEECERVAASTSL